ncbi:MAG: hypothetical protein Q8L66_03925 [Caulobacter sp.]|nr:hypothetical protein [Caulobacter sp.]
MSSRRDVVLGGAALAAGAALPVRAQTYVAPEQVSLAVLDSKAIRTTMGRNERLAVLGYRLGIITRSGISASTGQGTVSMEASVELTGVTLADARAIADLAYADLIGKLAETGRPIATLDEIRATKGYRLLKPAPIPFVKKPFTDARVAAIVSPNGQDLFFQHADSPLTDKSPMDLVNWRAINQMSVDLGNAVILTPVVVVDFAELSGSGHKVYGGSASVGVKPGIYVVNFFSGLGANQAKIALAGDGGRALLQKRIAVGQAGEFVKTGGYGNQAEVAWWNSMASTASSNIGRPTLSYEVSNYQYRVDPPLFAKAVLDGCKAMNRAYAEAAATMQPGR